MVERCRTDDLMPNVHFSCLPPSRVDHEVQGLKVIVDTGRQEFLHNQVHLGKAAGGETNRAETKRLTPCSTVQGGGALDDMCHYAMVMKGNGKKADIALNDTPSQTYGTSLAIWDHTVLPATPHK